VRSSLLDGLMIFDGSTERLDLTPRRHAAQGFKSKQKNNQGPVWSRFSPVSASQKKASCAAQSGRILSLFRH
jgi:hypothetical protein